MSSCAHLRQRQICKLDKSFSEKYLNKSETFRFMISTILVSLDFALRFFFFSLATWNLSRIRDEARRNCRFRSMDVCSRRMSLHQRNSCKRPSYFFSFHAYSRATRVSRDAWYARRNRVVSFRSTTKGVCVRVVVVERTMLHSKLLSQLFIPVALQNFNNFHFFARL